MKAFWIALSVIIILGIAYFAFFYKKCRCKDGKCSCKGKTDNGNTQTRPTSLGQQFDEADTTARPNGEQIELDGTDSETIIRAAQSSGVKVDRTFDGRKICQLADGTWIYC